MPLLFAKMVTTPDCVTSKLPLEPFGAFVPIFKLYAPRTLPTLRLPPTAAPPTIRAAPVDKLDEYGPDGKCLALWHRSQFEGIL